jgi:pimeloyl-ACP methyl ester carboxylesterase
LLQSQLAYSKSTPQVHIEDLESVSSRHAVQHVALTYHDEVLPLLILRPTDRPPPFNPVIVFPGQNYFIAGQPSTAAVFLRSPTIRLMIESGRAIVWPIYFGSNERYAGEFELAPSDRLIYLRDANVTWRKELGRVIDYLETREDMRTAALAFLGMSYGTHHPIAAYAQEKRFKTLLLLYGGISIGGISEQGYPSLIRGEHHLPRITQPVLMINGRFDYIFPLEQSQKPMFELLGTPAAQKAHLLFDGEHAPPTTEIWETVTVKVVDWLDRYTPLPAGAAN